MLIFGKKNRVIFQNSPNQYEMILMINSLDDCQKPPTAAIFLPPEGPNLSNFDQKYETHLTSVHTIYEVNSVISSQDNG